MLDVLNKIRNNIYSVKVPTTYAEGGVDAIDIGPYSDTTMKTITNCFNDLNIKFSDLKNIYRYLDGISTVRAGSNEIMDGRA